MSLTTAEALNGAIADLVNAKLCLLDATEVDIHEERSQLENLIGQLENKLSEAAAKEVSEMKKERAKYE